jgi:hypothetical protein
VITPDVGLGVGVADFDTVGVGDGEAAVKVKSLEARTTFIAFVSTSGSRPIDSAVTLQVVAADATTALRTIEQFCPDTE